MSKSAEKLIILNDVGRGLLARAYNLTDKVFRAPPSLTPDMDKVCKLLVKKFPDHPAADLERTPGNEAFGKNATNIAAETKGMYLFFIDLMSWTEASWLLLKDISQNVVSMRFGQNTDLMALFLDLLSMYAKVNLLVARCSNATLYLSVYARAYHLNTGNSEPNFLRVAQYVGSHRDPLRELHEKCKSFGLSVGDTLVGMLLLVSKWSDPAMLQQKGTFSVLDDAKGMVDETKHFTDLQELQYVDRMREWILWGFLVCPAELKRDNALTLLGMCLKDTAVLRIARDEYLDVHHEYMQLFDHFKVDKWKLSKHKKTLKDAHKELGNTVRARAGLRTFLRVELARLSSFFTEFPQVLPPKLHLVYSLLRVARTETLWYFEHMTEAPRAVKGLKEDDFVDPRITDIVYGMHRLASLLRAHTAEVAAYYVGVLRSSDGPEVASVVDEFTRQAQVSGGLAELLGTLGSALRSPQPGDDYEAFRLNWYRVSATINSQQSGLVARGADKLNAVMSRVTVHTRCVDRVEKQLVQHASLSGLFWHRERLRDCLASALGRGQGQPRHCMVLVQVLNEGLRCVHRLCPEEQRPIGELSVRTAEQFMQTVMNTVAGLVTALLRQYKELSAQTAEQRVADILHAEQQNKHATLAGAESVMANRAVVANLAGWTKSLSEVCEAIRDADTVVVYNTEFVPREFLYATVEEQFTNAVVRCVRRESNDLERPTEMLRLLRLTIQAFSMVEEHCVVNLSDVVRSSLYRLFHDPRTGRAGESVENLAAAAAAGAADDDAGKQVNGALMRFVIHYYVHGVLKMNLQDLRVTYSPLRQGFVTYSPQQQWKAEDYMQISELIALCRLIGPSGFRAFERVLLGELVRGAEKIKALLAKLRPTLVTLKAKFTDSSVWYEALNDSERTRGLSTVVGVGVSLGVLLRFRSLLRAAMRQVSSETVPFILQAVESLHSAKPAGSQSSALTPLEVLATDVGAAMGNTDQGLRQALAPLKVTAEDEQLWDLLPELFGSTFVTEAWKGSRYMVSTESHNSNVHCMATAVAALIASFERVPVDNKPVPDDVEELTRLQLVRFARCAASSILHMNSTERRGQFSSFPMPSIMVFVEQFVSSSGLKLSVLEDFFPYSLLRSHYIQMYEEEAAQRGRSALGDDDQQQQQPQAAK